MLDSEAGISESASRTSQPVIQVSLEERNALTSGAHTLLYTAKRFIIRGHKILMSVRKNSTLTGDIHRQRKLSVKERGENVWLETQR